MNDNSNTLWCQHAQQAGGYIGRITKMSKINQTSTSRTNRRRKDGKQKIKQYKLN